MTKLLTAITLCFSLLLIGNFADARSYVANVSAYTWTGSPMANGEYPHEGAIAADDLPIGTKVRINGRIYTVKDRFGGGYSGRIDIYMDSYQKAINFGRQYLTVEIV